MLVSFVRPALSETTTTVASKSILQQSDTPLEDIIFMYVTDKELLSTHDLSLGHETLLFIISLHIRIAAVVEKATTQVEERSTIGAECVP